MRDAGYPAHSAAAIEAVASTGGQLMPPMMGAAAFVMAEFLEVEYREVVLAALIPAILYYVALFIQTDLQAARDGIKRVDAARIPARWPVLKAGWVFIIPFVVIIFALFRLNLSPEASALWAALALVPLGLLIGYKGVRMRPRQILGTLSETGYAVVEIMMIGAAAGIIMGVLNITGLGFALTLALVKMAQGNLALLLVLAALVCIVLGMGMPTLGVYILLALLVAPSIVEMGVDRMAAHLFVLYLGMMSMLTPPVAIAAFAAASVAKADAMRTGFAAVRLGWSAYVVPFLFVLSPELLMKGDAIDIAITFVTAVAGVWLASIGVVGYFARRLDVGIRLLFVAAGLSLLLPAGAFAWGMWSNAAGAGLAALLLTRELGLARRATAVEKRE
jgi:TRAP transporter 4TM/12TM fusion protein